MATNPPQPDDLCVVLVGTRNPLNIGAAARAMSNFGFTRLRVVRPFDPAFREARSAVDASDLLATAEVHASVASAIADCTLVVGTTAVGQREPQHPIRRPQEAAPLMRRRMASSRVALLFGSEKTGLSNRDLSHCHWLLRIPTRLEHRSMNLGQAVAICLYELVRGSRAIAPPARPLPPASDSAPASAEVQERFTELLLEALTASKFTRPAAAAATEEKVRRMVRRLGLPAADAETWLGMMRRMLWKMNAQGGGGSE